jgi:hypothetical protein
MTYITDIREMKARSIVFGVGVAGGNAVNNMIAAGLQGVDFITANTEAQSSQLMVTPLQDTPTTVLRSVVVTPQQTRSPTTRVLDWSPVINKDVVIGRRPRSPHDNLR